MSRDRWRFGEGNYPHFMTCTIVGWLPLFTRPFAAETIFESWRYLQTERNMILFGYVILENHLHWIAKLADPAKDCANFKSYTARRIIDQLTVRNEQGILDQFRSYRKIQKLDRDYQLWQEGSHPIELKNDEMLRQKLEYSHYNPVERGYVDKPIDWRYSSARNYANLPGLINVVTQW